MTTKLTIVVSTTAVMAVTVAATTPATIAATTPSVVTTPATIAAATAIIITARVTYIMTFAAVTATAATTGKMPFSYRRRISSTRTAGTITRRAFAARAVSRRIMPVTRSRSAHLLLVLKDTR